MSSNNLTLVIAEIEDKQFIKLNEFLQPNKIELKPERHLITDLAGNYGALIVRTILFHLGVDENRIFQWRLEHKFRQYQILSHYIPEYMPHTLALSTVLCQDDGAQKARELFDDGYFLKATLGDASFATNSWDKTHLFNDVYPNRELYEGFMIQKKLKLVREFRIHTFSRELIPYLTFRIPATQDMNFHHDAEQFLTRVLSKLPDQILYGTLIGWDVGLTNTGEYYVIESNLTGFHPEYRRGFQTTGYVDNHQIGPIICAWLNNYFKLYFHLHISTIDPVLSSHPFYQAFEEYSLIFDKTNFQTILTKAQPTPDSVLIYIEEESSILINLINHFHYVDFATNYYVITRQSNYDILKSLFSKKKQVKIIDEAGLFTLEQYKVIVQLEYKKRKQISCHRAARRLNETYLIL
jgi:hypothetical protein